MNEFVKIGHRGAAGHYPENTIGSFAMAIKLGADAIEFDVRLSADKKVVVIHDATLDRTTNGNGPVDNFTYEELRRLDAGNGEKIPTLEQVFGVFNKGNPWGWKPSFHIELKEGLAARHILNLIQQYNLVDSVIISAFSAGEIKHGNTAYWSNLGWIKDHEPDLRLARLIKSADEFRRAIENDFGLKMYALNPSRDIVTREMAAAAHEKGMKIFVWTANHQNDIARIKAMGVDGIFSDYPDRL